jgi:type I restriction enzyme S subunit
VSIKYGKTLPTAEFTQSGYPVFGANGIIGAYSRYLYEERQVLISCRGAYSGTINLSPPLCFITNNSLVLEIASPQLVSKEYLFYALQTVDKSKLLTGSAQPQVTINNAKVLDVPLAPLPEQRRIVAEIEKQFTRLEAGVAALRRVQASLKRYHAAILKAACEGRLVPTEAELARVGRVPPRGTGRAKNAASGDAVYNDVPYETGEQLLQRILAERRRIHERSQLTATRRKKYKEPSPPSIPVEEQLPEGWTWATWDQIGLSQNGRPFPSAEYQEAGFKLLRPGNLHVSGKIVWTEDNIRCMPQRFADENPDLIVRGRELVMNLTAQSLKDEFLGRVCITCDGEGCLLNQRLARLTPIVILPEFVLYLLKAWRFRRFVDGLNSGSLIQHMFTSQLAEFTFPLPPLAEQKRIVAEVERRLSVVVEELEAMVSANLHRAARLRLSILTHAFTG